jgi:hypothetical protein
MGLLLSAATSAQATAVYEMRDYFESLSSPYPAQSAGDLWTFHNGDHNGALLPPSGDNYHQPGGNYQQIGLLVDSGTHGCSSGYCGGSVPDYTLATFDGVFVHPNSNSATAAVFHASEAMDISEIKLWSETVANGHNGNGFDVTVNAIIGGIGQSIGSFLFNYPLTTTGKLETLYTPVALTLQAGDMIEILYGNNGSWLYDHGNVNAFITGGSATAAAPASSVPAPGTLALLLAGTAGIMAKRRRQIRPTELAA